MSSDNNFFFPIHWILFLSVIVALAMNVTKYVIFQDYTYMVEAECDPTTHECYIRDCDNEYCPPNNLALYRVFTLPATAFAACADNSCINVCTNTASPCTELRCTDQDEIVCSIPTNEPSE